MKLRQNFAPATFIAGAFILALTPLSHNWYNGDMENKKFNASELTNSDGCFDLQFRKDTRHGRTGAPTYYRWTIQFIVTLPKANVTTLAKLKKEIGCGTVTTNKNQARYAVQKIDDIMESVVPFFTKNKLSGNKKKDFDLWKKAAVIIFKNKGIYLSKWQKNDLLHLLQIHKSSAQYKTKPRKQKWYDMAQTLTKTQKV